MNAVEEFERSGLAGGELPGSSAKLRLMLDLAALVARTERLRVLDVGCAGPEPLNLWEPFLPLRGRLELVGVDVAGLDRAHARAQQLGLDIELREVSANDLTASFGRASFDAVTTTQVLEHLQDWRGALREMGNVLRPGGMLFLTCDSGEVRSPFSRQARLFGKRAYARLRRDVPTVGKAGDQFLSGEWERGVRRDELAAAFPAAGFDVLRLALYSLHDVKVAQRHAGSVTRLLWLSLEETLAEESAEPVDPSLYAIVYANARRRS